MTIKGPIFAGAIALVAALAAPGESQARFFDPALQRAESIVEDVACRIVRERIVRPNGRVVYRQTRRCDPPRFRHGPRFGRDCRVVRDRIVRPNGSVVYRTVRRCR